MATRTRQPLPLRTAGTQLFILNRRTGTLFEVGCLTSMGDISSPKQLEDAGCMRDLVSSEAVVGEAAGSTNIGIRFDYRKEDNIRLFRAYKESDELTFLLGFPQFDEDGLQIHPDDAEVPVVDTTDPLDPEIELGGDRVYLVFDGQITSFDLPVNRGAYFDVTLPVTIQGGIDFKPEGALPEITD